MVDVRVPDFRFCEGRTILRGSIEGVGTPPIYGRVHRGGCATSQKGFLQGSFGVEPNPKPRGLYSASYEHEIRPHDSLIRVSRLIATGQFPRRVYLVGIHLTVINVQIEPPVVVRS